MVVLRACMKILPYTYNRKLGNLGKCCFTSNFDSSCKLRSKNDKKLTETKTYRSRYAFRKVRILGEFSFTSKFKM